MRIQQILEGISQVLYHSTRAPGFGKIMTDNQFQLTPDLGSQLERGFRKGKRKLYYFSTSRSRTGAYHYPTKEYSNGTVLFKLDGAKLMADGYSGAPLDYWADPEMPTYADNDEMEDRVYSTSPVIPNAVKYITEIHIYYNPSINATSTQSAPASLRAGAIAAKRAGIPVYVYTDINAYNLLKTSASTDASVLAGPQVAAGPDIMDTNNTKPFDEYTELLKAPRPNISRGAQMLLTDIQSRDTNYSINTLDNIMLKYRKGPRRPILDQFVRQMQRLNLHSPDDVINYIRKRFQARAV